MSNDDTPMTREQIRTLWQEMIDERVLVPTGKYRPDGNGVMRPVYRLRDGLSESDIWPDDVHRAAWLN